MISRHQFSLYQHSIQLKNECKSDDWSNMQKFDLYNAALRVRELVHLGQAHQARALYKAAFGSCHNNKLAEQALADLDFLKPASTHKVFNPSKDQLDTLVEL